MRFLKVLVYVSLENTLMEANENNTDTLTTIKAALPVDVDCVDDTRVVVAAVVIGCAVAKATMILFIYLVQVPFNKNL